MTTLKSFLSCDGMGLFTFSFEPYYGSSWICEAPDAPPTGFQEILDANNVLRGYTLTNVADGTYSIQVNAAAFGGTYEGYLLEFIVGDCDTMQDVGCCNTDAVTIRWLGREGAIKEWYFNGVKEYEVEVGEANTFKNTSRQLQYSQRKDIYNGKMVSTKSISRAQVDFLDELKYSIQAWEWDGTTATAITLNNDSFFKYKSRDKLFDLSIRYVIAEEVIVQTQ